jgi:hypothetical protein
LTAAVSVAGPVVAGRWWYAEVVEGAGDAGGAMTGEALAEDPPDVGCGGWVGVEAV